MPAPQTFSVRMAWLGREAATRSQRADVYGRKQPSRSRGSATDGSRPVRAILSARSKSLQTVRNTSKEKSSPTTATISGQDVQEYAE